MLNPSDKFDELAGCLQSWSSSDLDFVLVRYNPDGTPDTSFGSGGTVTTAFSELDDSAVAVRIQSDGKLIVAGQTSDEKRTVPCDADSYYNSRFALARYNSNGSLDTSFGTGGLVTTMFSGSQHEYASALALQSDGKIVVAGDASIFDPDHPNDYRRANALFRYNRDGSLDLSFGSGGKITLGFSNHALAFQSDGKIVASGSELLPRQGNLNQYNFVLARYNNDSSPSLHPATVHAGDPFTFKFPLAVRDATYLDIRFRSLAALRIR